MQEPPGQPPNRTAPPLYPPQGAGQYGSGSPPYWAPQPSPKKFPWWILIALAGVGFIVFGLFIAGAIYGFRNYIVRSHSAALRASTSAPARLSRSYKPRVGLIVAHYPSDFAAKNLDDDTLLLDRNVGFGQDEAVLLAAVDRPISDDVNEFARVLLLANQRHIVGTGGSYRELSRAPAACFRGMPGLEVSSQGTLKSGVVVKMWTCFFMHSGHGYEFKTISPSWRSASDGPLLRRIVAATELSD